MSEIYKNLLALQNFQISIARAEVSEGDDKYANLDPEDDIYDSGEEDDFRITEEDLTSH
jgi:hypothetical protein